MVRCADGNGIIFPTWGSGSLHPTRLGTGKPSFETRIWSMDQRFLFFVGQIFHDFPSRFGFQIKDDKGTSFMDILQSHLFE